LYTLNLYCFARSVGVDVEVDRLPIDEPVLADRILDAPMVAHPAGLSDPDAAIAQVPAHMNLT
jgi:hypothetical protein